ncbi:hypothetical protein H4219_000721 [Mycoemilia scoparia]|uniref:Cation efflux protein transmembrane domain-containing protein n=1 Tax=Mycoemilia scoparia TaxID=417184 RepID=A0A9W8DRA1_9FUNG|nr:hypothetical protein H4219_000721 [Mycoemilia scoparia]
MKNPDSSGKPLLANFARLPSTNEGTGANYGTLASTATSNDPSSHPRVFIDSSSNDSSSSSSSSSGCCCGNQELAGTSASTTAQHSINNQTLDEENRILADKLRGSMVQEDDIPTIKNKCGKDVAQFYINQNDLILSMLEVHNDHSDEDIEQQASESKLYQEKVRFAIHISVAANIVLSVVQLYVALSSHSLSLFATMADAMMDLLSSLILLFASIAAEQKDTHKRYPSGRSRIETVGIIIFASLMGAFSTGLLMESITSLLSQSNERNSLNLLNGMCIVVALATKLALFFYCFALRKNHSAHVLMLDHRNDLFVNSFGLSMALLGRHLYPWIDPLGCLVVALFILRSWIREAWEQMQLIVGISADPAFLQLLTYTAMTHHPLITHVDTVRAYHSGARLFVEVDIVMAPETPLRIIHDVAETLQNRYERMDCVERAFVHVDYECLHHPEHSPTSYSK